MITFKEAALYFEKKVRVVTTDKKEIIGIVTGIENDFDTFSGEDELEIDLINYYLGLPLSEIENIEELKEYNEKM
jgi:small nuclear ribonucleoprotein (snRNP)-like protein